VHCLARFVVIVQNPTARFPFSHTIKSTIPYDFPLLIAVVDKRHLNGPFS